MAVSVKTEPTFNPGKPVAIFQGTYFPSSYDPFTIATWDISPDGKLFLMMKESTGDASTEGTSSPKINIVVNWFEEVKERVPVP